MRKPTGQMREETQKYLDDYNLLYNWDYYDMCDFIENYGETMFLSHYETYHRLCEDYSEELVHLFADEFVYVYPLCITQCVFCTVYHVLYMYMYRYM